MRLIFKGTYETNHPHPWREIHQNDYLSSQPQGANQPIPLDDFKLYFDFSEIAISRLDQRASEIEEDDWSPFFRTRTLLCPVDVAQDGTPLKTCREQSGLKNHNDFFEEGLRLDGEDVQEGDYKTLSIIHRRMVTSPATQYNETNEPTPATAFFDSKEVLGYDAPFNLIYSYSLEDNTNDQDSRILPFINQNLNIRIDSSKRPYTFEVRIFFKNLMMNHLIFDSSLSPPRFTFVGPSDWSANHAFDDNSEPNDQKPVASRRLGGNILITARTYFHDDIGSLKINRTGPVCEGGPGQTNGLSYFALAPAESDFESRRLPLAATKYQESTETIENLPTGSYDLYITYDRLMNTASGEMNGKDGFPESFRLCESQIQIAASSETETDISACVCP